MLRLHNVEMTTLAVLGQDSLGKRLLCLFFPSNPIARSFAGDGLKINATFATEEEIVYNIIMIQSVGITGSVTNGNLQALVSHQSANN